MAQKKTLIVLLVAFLTAIGVYGIYYGYGVHSAANESNEDVAASTKAPDQVNAVKVSPEPSKTQELNKPTVTNVEAEQVNTETSKEQEIKQNQTNSSGKVKKETIETETVNQTELSQKVVKKVEEKASPSSEKESDNTSSHYSSVKKFFNEIYENFSSME